MLKRAEIVKRAFLKTFGVMKGMALADRMKEKDAWDVYYCLRHYPGGVDALVQVFMPQMANRLVREGLEKIGGKFESPNHVGPKWVADFEEIADREARDRLQRDAYERVAAFLLKLGIR